MSLFSFVAILLNFLSLGGFPSLTVIAAAYTREAVGVFLVFTYLAFGLTSLMALLLSLYALAARKQK